VESPEFLNLFFAASKQRPQEARFVACKKRFKNEDLERKAGNSFLKSIEVNQK